MNSETCARRTKANCVVLRAEYRKNDNYKQIMESIDFVCVTDR